MKLSTRNKTSYRRRGSALLVTLGTLVALSAIAAITISVAQSRYNANYQAVGWSEALYAAESGVDYGLDRLRTGVTTPSVFSNTLNKSLQKEIDATWSGGTPANGTAATNPDGSTRITLPLLTMKHGGQGNTQQQVSVTVDRVPSANMSQSGSGAWYRIRSTGTVPLTGGHRLSGQKEDNLLRKLRFLNSTGGVLSAPQTIRTVEVIARPVSVTTAALWSITGMTFSGQNVTIDAYDSRLPGQYSDLTGNYPLGTDSTSIALRDAMHRDLQNANVVSNDTASGTLVPGINLGNNGATIYGQVTGNTVAPFGSSANVSYADDPANKVGTGYYRDAPTPPNPADAQLAPSWTTATTLPTADASRTLATGTAAAPARYKVAGNLVLSGGSTWTVTPPATGEGYVEIWVTGSTSMSGNASIVIPRNVNAVFYFDGNTDLAGNGVINQSFVPKNVAVYGNPSATSTQTMTIRGNGAFAGVVYAPNSRLSIEGGGTTGDLFGAFVGRYINFTGGTVLHYDLALAEEGMIAGYRMASWYEDNVLTR